MYFLLKCTRIILPSSLSHILCSCRFQEQARPCLRRPQRPSGEGRTQTLATNMLFRRTISRGCGQTRPCPATWGSPALQGLRTTLHTTGCGTAPSSLLTGRWALSLSLSLSLSHTHSNLTLHTTGCGSAPSSPSTGRWVLSLCVCVCVSLSLSLSLTLFLSLTHTPP
jgi:hypothetical protein